jgi:SAM-dependent methyltransferase
VTRTDATATSAIAAALRLTARWLGPKWTTRARCIMRGRPLPRWGNLRRTEPLSTEFGFDRGTPIDRYYVDDFLGRHRAVITGRVLEIQGSGYTRRFGHDLIACDTLDINPRFAATYTCDLAHAEHVVPDNAYDCFLLPNTFQHLRDIDRALANARRIVRPGGAIVVTAAAFMPLIPDGPDYWRITADGWCELTARHWPADEVAIVAYGNCLAAIAAMHGIAVEEVTPAELDVRDPRYPVLVGIMCRKRDHEPA